jgi:AraC-like DNA-binding protein
VLPHLIAWVEKQGGNAAAIRGLPGLDDLDDPDARIPETTADTAWRLAASAINDDAIGVHVAESMPRGALDLVEYAFRASPTLGAGLERLARYGRVLSDRAAARVEHSGDGLLLLVRDAGTSPLHPGRNEFALAMALRFARDGTGVPIAPRRVSFAHDAPDDLSEYRRFFNCPLQFAGGANSMILTVADAARPLLGADPALLSVVRRHLDKALLDRSRPETGSMTSRVRHLVVEALGQTSLTPDAVAKSIGVSRRTLSRRLAEEHTSFREILDDVRSEFARALLLDPTLSVSDIAFFLQYSEPAAFHRSFRRWTAQTPSSFRRAARAQV